MQLLTSKSNDGDDQKKSVTRNADIKKIMVEIKENKMKQSINYLRGDFH